MHSRSVKTLARFWLGVSSHGAWVLSRDQCRLGPFPAGSLGAATCSVKSVSSSTQEQAVQCHASHPLDQRTPCLASLG